MWCQKIFNISMHRSGGQSVHDLLVRSGISSVHFPALVKGINYQNLVTGHESDTSRVADTLLPVIKMVTAVSDAPIAALYEALECGYPNSAFILIYRNPFDWVRSVRNHIGDRDFDVFERVQYWRYLDDKPMSLIRITDNELYSAYLSHVRDVLAFFRKRDNLLFLDLQDPDAGPSICRFLRVPPISLRHIDFRLGHRVRTQVFNDVYKSGADFVTSEPSKPQI